MAHALSHTTAGFGIFAAFTNALESFRATLARRSAYNKLFAELNALSLRELDDIGIAPWDIEKIAREHASY